MITKHFALALLVLMCFSGTSKAQNLGDDQKLELEYAYKVPLYQASLSYFGEWITHSGFRAGFSTSFLPRIKDHGSDRFSHRSWTGGGYLTYYRHRRNHQGYLLTGAIGRQRTGHRGFQTSIQVELGYMLSRLDGEVFSWEDGAIVEGKKGSSHFVLGLNGGIGWNFNKQMQIPIALMLQPHLYLQAPYNTSLMPRAAMEIKLIYEF